MIEMKNSIVVVVLNGGISRLKHHLSRLPSKGVNPCAKVRDDVTDRVRSILSAKDDPPITNKYKPPPPLSPPFDAPASKLVFPSSPPNAQDIAERSISLFFFENKIDFAVARSPSYHHMLDAVAKCGPGFVAPSPKTEWLDRVKSDISLQLKDTEKEWVTTGCTIIAEAWTDNKSRALINFSVSSPSRIFFHKSVDASSYFKNSKCLADLFDSVIQDIGQEHIVQIIMDNSFCYTGISNHLLQNYATIFVSPCASQCLNIILEEFSKVDWVNQCISQAQVISKFVYNNSPVLDLLRKLTGGQDIIRSGVTRSVSNFLSLQSMMKQKARLKHMFNCPEYTTNTNKPQSISCVNILEDNDFWRAVEESVAISEPILKVLREVSTGKPAVGSIYELMSKAKESIRTYYIMDENKHKVFSDIVDTNWCDHLHSPLHAAAAFLNPSIQYNPEIKFLTSLKEDFFKVLEKLLPTSDLRRDITNQIFTFTRAKGMFGCNLAMEARDSVSPGLWWEQFGDSAPVLQRVAIRILSQVCSGYNLERQWSTFQQMHWERRNKIDREILNKLAYVNQNLKLGRMITLETDPIALEDIDMMSEWVEEAENPSPAHLAVLFSVPTTITSSACEVLSHVDELGGTKHVSFIFGIHKTGPHYPQFNQLQAPPPPPPPSAPPPLVPDPPRHQGPNDREKGASKQVGRRERAKPDPSKHHHRSHLPHSKKIETEEERRLRKKRELEKQRQDEKHRQQMKNSHKSQMPKGHTEEKKPTPLLTTDRVENRLKKPTTFICKLKFRNELPDPSAQLKLMTIKRDKDQFTKYTITSLEKLWKPKIFVEPDLGIPLDLLDLSVYNPPKVKAPLAPEDEELLRDDDAVTPIKKDGIRRKERPTDKGMSWLVKTQYISSINNESARQSLTEKQAKELREMKGGINILHNLNNRCVVSQISSFEACKSRPVHATNKNLQPVEVLPLLPYFDRYDEQFVVANFDGAPIADSEFFGKLDPSIRDAHESRAILKSYVVAGSDTANPEKFLAYMVPSLDELSKDIHDENEEISYTWVREYLWDVQPNANDPGTYLVSFDNGTASYLPLPMRLNLRKKRAREGRSSDEIEHFPVPSRVTVRRRSTVSVIEHKDSGVYSSRVGASSSKMRRLEDEGGLGRSWKHEPEQDANQYSDG
ncbi:unnamed protein product [Arabidopsis thaliana]|nr:unnamed protein product [Arabidopsis thaliana]